MTVEDVDRLGQGRVWTGRQAKENGLVDELGGLSLAIAIARQHAGLGEKSFEIVQFRERTWLSQIFGNLLFPFTTLSRTRLGNGSVKNAEVETEAPLWFITRYAGLNTTARLLNIIRKQRLFLLMPYHISVSN